MKAIILTAGSSTRLYPASLALNKALLPIYDKPMIYYPLSTVMSAGIRDILIITSPRDAGAFKALLGTGEQWGIKLSYAVQTVPKGIADAFLIGESFIEKDPVCLMLGDNILHCQEALPSFEQAKTGALVFGYHVEDPERYGVLGFDASQQVNDIVEKPKNPASNYAVIGIYFYDNQVVKITKSLKPSARGELEITDVNRAYLQQKQLRAHLLPRETVWFDTGTHDSMLQASQSIQQREKQQNIKIGCPEEVAWRQKFISTEQLQKLAEPLLKSGYGQYLLDICQRQKKF
jgi:glucose-1-phosphate thymidylyltransferase